MPRYRVIQGNRVGLGWLQGGYITGWLQGDTEGYRVIQRVTQGQKAQCWVSAPVLH